MVMVWIMILGLVSYAGFLLWQNKIKLGEIWDYIIHRSEYNKCGKGGERSLFLALRRLGLPEEQIFRNVYIPALDNNGCTNGKTTEIDIVVLSKKGVLIFEHKTYAGRIYGDGKAKKWVHYVGGKRYIFLSPVEQNRYHKFCLDRFLQGCLPIYTFITYSRCGNWRVKNLPKDAHFLDGAGQLMKIYNELPSVNISKNKFYELQGVLAKLSRPNNEVVEQHIAKYGK